jgi:hypothetical protein
MYHKSNRHYIVLICLRRYDHICFKSLTTLNIDIHVFPVSANFYQVNVRDVN